jgi:CDP-diacylglycerol---glycerol-3-phosphate 3-phosphatidyltransferase
MNLPNKLTLSRFISTFVISFFLLTDFPFSTTAALILFILSSLTDYWDGYLARNKYGITEFGQLMDPLADKLMICSVFVCLNARDLISAWLVIIVMSREFLVTGLRLVALKHGKVISAAKWGKYKMVAQVGAIVLILLATAFKNDVLPALFDKQVIYNRFLSFYNSYFEPGILVISIIVIIFTLLSGIIYFYNSKNIVFKNA